MTVTLSRLVGSLVLGCVLHLTVAATVAADEVHDWNAIAVRAMQVPPAVPGPLQPRLLAIVHAAIFDAVNGIARRYTPIEHDAEGPRRASRRAAAVQAAYTALATLLPAQADALEADLLASIAVIEAVDTRGSIRRGRAWGEEVARAILVARDADGLNPPAPVYLGSLDVGKWRPTPRPNPVPGDPELEGLPGLVPSLGLTTPFVIPSPSSFRPAGPPPLMSVEYARGVNEVKRVGSLTSTVRTDDQTESARFWAGSAAAIWNRAAVDASRQRSLTLLQNARLLALLNMAMIDAVIAAWDAKYYFEFWRPVTAIRLADTDANPRTVEDPAWLPLITTPPYPDYLSGHQAISGSAQAILTAYFGNRTRVESYSEGVPGVVRAWRNFAAAADEALLARIWSGIHFRFTMDDTRVVGERVAAYVLRHAAQPLASGD